MPLASTVFYLIGPPAAGKLTIAKEVAERIESTGLTAMVLDNHYFNDPIINVVRSDGIRTLPDRVWHYASEVRATVLAAVEELSPADWSFVFTNHLRQGERARASFDRLAELALRRSSTFVPVRLECEPEELARRAANADRKARRKWIDPAGVRREAEEQQLFVPDHPHLLRLDTTSREPAESANQVLAHAVRLAQDSAPA